MLGLDPGICRAALIGGLVGTSVLRAATDARVKPEHDADSAEYGADGAGCDADGAAAHSRGNGWVTAMLIAPPC